MHLTRAFRHAGRFPAILFASMLLLATSCAHVRAQPAPLANTFGELKTAVILVNFTDNTSQPKTAAEANSLVFGQVSDFFWEASYQKTLLSGDTFGWFTIAASPTLCDTATIVSEGNRAATAAGANLAAYTHFVYMFPFRSGCSWSGTGAVGPAGEKIVYINGTAGFALKTIAHEMGHGFGLLHSDGLDCDVSPLGNTCTQRGYADPTDIMGSQSAHFNAFQKERLGWLNTAGVPPITTVTTSGRHVIKPMETMDAGPKALKILKDTNPTTGEKTWYYLEYRQPVGFDAVLSGRGNMTSGVVIHTGRVSNSGIATSLLLDMTPNSNIASKSADFEDGAIPAGASFADTAAGVTFTVVAVDANGAVVDVVVNGSSPLPSCTRAAPTISLSGPTTAVAAGSSVNYTLSLSNRDSSACAATTFNLARSVPSGWTGTLATSTLSLSPGANGSTTLTVTSPTGAGSGAYGIGAGASSSVGSTHTANASTTYSVASAASGGTLTETVGTDKSSYLRGQTVYMSALVKNNGVAVGGATVKFNVTLSNSSVIVLTATSGSDGYARSTYGVGKGKGAIGNYAVRADATSGGSSVSASANFSVN